MPKYCIFDNCIKHSNYNLPTEKKAIYCVEHKKENMISINNKKCQYINCNDNSLFGYLDKRPQFCNKHKENNMINLFLENKCNVIDCHNEYNFTINNEKYCLKHAPTNYDVEV